MQTFIKGDPVIIHIHPTILFHIYFDMIYRNDENLLATTQKYNKLYVRVNWIT